MQSIIYYRFFLYLILPFPLFDLGSCQWMCGVTENQRSASSYRARVTAFKLSFAPCILLFLSIIYVFIFVIGANKQFLFFSLIVLKNNLSKLYINTNLTFAANGIQYNKFACSFYALKRTTATDRQTYHSILNSPYILLLASV